MTRARAFAVLLSTGIVSCRGLLGIDVYDQPDGGATSGSDEADAVNGGDVRADATAFDSPDDNNESDRQANSNPGADVNDGTLPEACGEAGCASLCQAGTGSTHLCAGACVPNDIHACGANCTDCDTAMVSNSKPSCDGTMCTLACDTNYTSCGDACVDTTSDDNNCNQCGKVCDGGSHCNNGSCACIGLAHMCGDTCVANDANACGSNCTKCGIGQDCFDGMCGCTEAAGCPIGHACDPISHTCSTSCDGLTGKCNGGCCDGNTCSSGLGSSGGDVCGSGGVLCASSCVLGACDSDPLWNGGSCECDQDSRCVGNPTGTKCVGVGGAGLCGCLTNTDCINGYTCNPVGVTVGASPGGFCE
jgi:hypothetical protein